MKIVICDYKDVMEADYGLTVETLKQIIPECEIIIQPFTDEKQLVETLKGADGLITAFLPLGESFFSTVESLKCVSISAVGYSSIDLESAKKHGVAVCHINEYCTDEVAEHTIALMTACHRNLIPYRSRIEKDHSWKFHEIEAPKPLSAQTLSIFGFGKIGQRVAQMAKAFGMNVLAVDPFMDAEKIRELQAVPATREEALEKGDVITNHMNLSEATRDYFNAEAFGMMKRKPVFLNVGRGGSVNEKDLLDALENGQIKSAGLDVLADENPDLENHPLVGRDDVIVTPHSAFYSSESMRKLQTISAANLAYCLTGKNDRISKQLV